jgi:hypothetical protein
MRLFFCLVVFRVSFAWFSTWPDFFGVKANEEKRSRDSTMNVRKQQIAQTENVWEIHLDGKIE